MDVCVVPSNAAAAQGDAAQAVEAQLLYVLAHRLALSDVTMQIMDLALGWSDAVGMQGLQGDLEAMVTSTLPFTSCYHYSRASATTHNQSSCVLLVFNWEVCHTPCSQYMTVKSPTKKLSSCSQLGINWQSGCLSERVQICRLRCALRRAHGRWMQSLTQLVTWQTLSSSTL